MPTDTPHQPDTEREAFCCEHSFKAAKDEAWRTRPLRECRCDHCEYCLKCLPAEFRAGGFWDAGYQPGLTAAKAQIARLEAERDEWHDRATEAQAERDAARDELAEARATVARMRAEGLDARRYQWLRSECQKDDGLTIAKVGPWGLEPWSGDDPDSAIDAALSATAKPQEGA